MGSANNSPAIGWLLATVWDLGRKSGLEEAELALAELRLRLDRLQSRLDEHEWSRGVLDAATRNKT